MNGPRVMRATIVALAFVMFSCAGPENRTTPAASDSETGAPVEHTAVPDIELRSVTFDEWTRELESMKGDIVVVDLWATWCAPCIERFPKMVTMSDRYSDHGVRFVSLSLDDRDDESTVTQVTRFLQKNDASNMSNYLMDEIIPDAFEKLDLLGVPAVFVYDAVGERRYRLTGDDPNDQFTEEDVEQAIESLLSAE